MLEGLRAALRDEDSVLLQHGATEPVDLPGEVEAARSMSAERLEAEIAACDVVVAHAGTGIALSSLMAGHRPVLVARSAHEREHVDDHQLHTADELDRSGLAIAATPAGLRRGTLARAAADRVVARGLLAPVQL